MSEKLTFVHAVVSGNLWKWLNFVYTILYQRHTLARPNVKSNRVTQRHYLPWKKKSTMAIYYTWVCVCDRKSRENLSELVSSKGVWKKWPSSAEEIWPLWSEEKLLAFFRTTGGSWWVEITSDPRDVIKKLFFNKISVWYWSLREIGQKSEIQ